MSDEPRDPNEPDDEDFEALLEASFQKERPRLNPGDRVRATVVQVGRENLILDLGDGRDALMDLGELQHREEGSEVSAGDTIEAFVLRVQDGVPEIGYSLGRAFHGRLQLEQAFEAELPVQGRVESVNKGGFVVEVAGLRGFCPMGAMDIRYVEDPQTFVGQSLEFLVTELRGRNDVVLSRRRLLERERELAAVETREKLEVGARLAGVVTNVRDFGAFVDLGGIEGLVPASELGFGRIRPEERVEPGQPLEVEVLRMETDDKGRERITLSLKSLMDDPFEAVAKEVQPGLVVLGTVTRLQPFGAFVQLVPGVEGLIHVSAFGKRIGHPQEVVQAGQEVAVRVDSVDAEQRRIGLHLLPDEAPATPPPASSTGLRALRLAEPPAAPEEAPAGAAPRVGDVHEVTVDRVKRFGVFVSWPGGQGLVPNRELGVGHGEDPGRKFPEGSKFQAAVIEVREDGKVTLSKDGAARAQEQAEADAWKKRSSSTPGLGTLGDLLKAKRRD